MVNYPTLRTLSRKKKTVSAYTGLDRRPVPASGALGKLLNLTPDNYPYLETRPPRGRVRALLHPHGLIAAGGLILAAGETLYHNGAAVAGLTLTDTDKQMALLGEKLAIFPDKVLYDTAGGAFEPMERVNTASETTAVRISTRDGGAYDTVTVSAEQPESPANGDLWLDTSGEEHVLKLFSSLYGTWQSMAAPAWRTPISSAR